MGIFYYHSESMWCNSMPFCIRSKLHTETCFSKYWCQHCHLVNWLVTACLFICWVFALVFFSHLMTDSLLTFTCRNSWKIIWSPTPKTWKAKSFIWRWKETTSVIWQRWLMKRPRMVSKSELCVSYVLSVYSAITKGSQLPHVCLGFMSRIQDLSNA